MVLRGAPSGPVIAGDIVAGARLYGENCAACHGARLEGQPDWRTLNPDGSLPAPPHDETGHTWHHGDGVLIDYTKLGGEVALARQGVEFASGMPAFGDRLDDRQIRDILAYIQSTWPERECQVQAARTEAEALEGNARR
jgi:mono/diheme cytochrome c family protein